MSLHLQWTRPASVTYPNVWITFQEKDLNSDKLVEYRIQDLPESMFEKGIQHMIDNYLHDEPISNFFDGINDSDHVLDYVNAWRAILQQKAVLVCLKTGSDEIVGINMNYVLSKADTFVKDMTKTCISKITRDIMKMFTIMYEDFDVFKKYETDQILASFGLSVAREYRGRRIGERLLKARKLFGEKCGLKLTHTFFSSNFSNQIADNVGFKVDVKYSYEEIQKIDPTIRIKGINSKEVTIKSWIF